MAYIVESNSFDTLQYIGGLKLALSFNLVKFWLKYSSLNYLAISSFDFPAPFPLFGFSSSLSFGEGSV